MLATLFLLTAKYTRELGIPASEDVYWLKIGSSLFSLPKNGGKRTRKGRKAWFDDVEGVLLF